MTGRQFSPQHVALGVDPGKDGGLVGLISHKDWGSTDSEARHWPLYAHQDFKNWGSWAQGLPELAKRIRIQYGPWIASGRILASVESVHSMAGEGHVGAFAFGMNYGSWLGLFAGLGIRCIMTPPDVWEATMGLTSNKAEHRKRAQQLWPGNADLFKSKGSDGLADAALLALFGTRFVGPLHGETPTGGYVTRNADPRAPGWQKAMDDTRSILRNAARDALCPHGHMWKYCSDCDLEGPARDE